jgi:hypothetical protein
MPVYGYEGKERKNKIACAYYDELSHRTPMGGVELTMCQASTGQDGRELDIFIISY